MQTWLDLSLNPTSTVLAYLDPGTGSYVLQIVLATLFGGLFAVKQFWVELKVWLASKVGSPAALTEPSLAPSTQVIRPQDLARPSVHGHSTAKVR